MAGAASGLLDSIFTAVDGALSSYLTNQLGVVMSSVSPVAHQCFTLYVILWGFAMYRGLISEPIMDAAFRLIKIGLILHFATNVGEFSSQVANNLTALPDYLAAIFGGGGTVAASKNALDGILTSSVDLGNSFWQVASMTNPGPYLYALMVYASSLVCIGYAAFLIILSKVALTVAMVAGPLFILGLMFEGTKKFFEAWIGQVINYAFVSGLAVGVVKLLFGIYANLATQANAVTGPDIGFQTIMGMLAMSIICLLVLMQVQTIAASLAGGVSISTMGAVNWASNKAQSLTGAMRPSNVQKAYRGIQRDARALKAGGQKLATPVAWAARKIAGSGCNSISAKG